MQSLHTAHCALETTHCTLRTAVTANCTLHTIHCTLQQGLTWHTPRDTDGPTNTCHTNTYKSHGAWHDTQQETEDTDGSTWSYVTERSRAVALGMDGLTQSMQHCIMSILHTAQCTDCILHTANCTLHTAHCTLHTSALFTDPSQ